MFLKMARFYSFLWLSNIPVCVCVCVCVCIHVHALYLLYSSIDRHLGCFHILAIINSAATNIGVHISFVIGILFSLGKYPEVELLDPVFYF